MKIFYTSSYYLLIVFLTFFSCTNKIETKADLVLMNGFIYTSDKNRTTAEAVAIKDGKFIFVGQSKNVEIFIDDFTQVIDLKGKNVLPGFIDSHCHPISTVKQLYDVNLNGLKKISDIQNAINSFREKHPNAKFIRGRGWSNYDFPNNGPDKKYLDKIISDIPVIMASEDGHSRWVNSKALELAGITKNTINPKGGIIERYLGSNEPSGTLRENATSLVNTLFPYYNLEELVAGLEAYQKMALALGITTAHDAYLDFGVDEIAAYALLEKKNKLNMRFRASIYLDPDLGIEQIKNLLLEQDKHKGDLFRINAAKIFIDGVVEGGTAYLKEPYNHLPNSHGKLLWNVNKLNTFCTELENNSIQIHVHAIGDAAVSTTLDAFEYAYTRSGKKNSRNLITHLQLVSPSDILRFKDLGIIAVPQPYWFKKDSYYYNIQVPYLGQKRADIEYPMKSFFSSGVIVASSSDYPVTIPSNPFIAIQTGITRIDTDSTKSDSALWADETVSLEQMITSFTINGAYANYLENITGSIEVGKSADLIIINSDIFNIPTKDICKTKVLLTLFKGKEVFRNENYHPHP
ncbi:MAG: amidohydrolase [Bacteroidetes bacterium]|nr:amidohydrolase [Bacteroidota bacterium]